MQFNNNTKQLETSNRKKNEKKIVCGTEGNDYFRFEFHVKVFNNLVMIITTTNESQMNRIELHRRECQGSLHLFSKYYRLCFVCLCINMRYACK